MAYNHIPVSDTTFDGRQLRKARDNLLQTIELLREVQGKMTVAIDGEDYTHMEAIFGLQAGHGTRAYGEINSMMAKIDTNDSVSNTQAAIKQFIDYIG